MATSKKKSKKVTRKTTRRISVPQKKLKCLSQNLDEYAHLVGGGHSAAICEVAYEALEQAKNIYHQLFHEAPPRRKSMAEAVRDLTLAKKSGRRVAKSTSIYHDRDPQLASLPPKVLRLRALLPQLIEFLEPLSTWTPQLHAASCTGIYPIAFDPAHLKKEVFILSAKIREITSSSKSNADTPFTETQYMILEELHPDFRGAKKITAEFLAKRLDKGVTTIKEAIKVLREARLVGNEPGFGYYRQDLPLPKPSTDYSTK